MSVGKNVNGQTQRPNKHNHPSGQQYGVSIGANLPLGNFSSTHIIGIEINHSWCNHRFGQMEVKPVKPIGFIGEVGAAYYFGKKEKVSGYSYNYPRYIFIHAFAGAIYNPWKKGNINLKIGPAAGIYNGHTQFNIGSSLEGNYYLTKIIAITPAIILMKESGADVIWAVSLKATWAF
jgi:hypothetical protein